MKKGWHVVKPVVEQKKKQSFSELLYGSPNWTRITDIMHTTVGGIERREEMMLAISTASVILENITPSSPFTVSLRSKQWLLSRCHC